MIRKVKFNNFYSFKDQQEINFLAKKKETYDYFQSDSDDQITKVAGFVGGNASGKTNVMRFFSFLGYFVCRKINAAESPFLPDIAYKPFFNNSEPSNFYIEFESDNSIFFYNFLIRKNVILEESLHIKKIQKKSKKIEIFSRKLGSIVSLNDAYFKHISKDAFPKIRGDVSFMAFIKNSAYDIDIIKNVYDYFLMR